MRATLAYMQRQEEIQRESAERHEGLIKDLMAQMQELVNNTGPREPSEYTLELKRDKDGRLDTVYARPGIME
jgi:hypothetical protein